mgnify:CR=1 FL=1
MILVFQNSLEMKCKALEVQLDGRGTVDICEERAFALREKNLSRSKNWAIALFFEVDPRIIQMKNALPRTVKEHTLGKTVEFHYDTWAEKSHKRRIKPPTDDNQWKILFIKNLCVTDDEE